MFAEHTHQWSRALTKSKGFQFPRNSFHIVNITLIDESTRSAEFADAYSALISREETQRFIARLEKSYTMAALQLLQSKEHKQDELRRKHETEITTVMTTANMPPRSMSIKHVREFEMLEGRIFYIFTSLIWSAEQFAKEFAEAQSVQKKEYKEFVVNMYKSKVVGQEATPKKPSAASEVVELDIAEEREGQYLHVL